jgi:alanyl-tRNA synthetase
VRRIEAVTGAAAARLFQERTERLNEIAARLKVPEHELVNAVERLSARVKELEKGPKGGSEVDVSALAERAARQDEVLVLVEALPGLDSNTLRDISDNVRQKLGDAIVMLGSETDGRVHLVANVSPSVVERGVSAADLVKTAAPIVGGGGGGRDTLAQAGGKDPDRLGEALDAARAEIEKALA